MLPLFKTAVSAGAYYLLGELMLRGGWSRLRLRRWASGAALLLLAAGVGWLGLALFVGSFFFHLADMIALVKPALIAGVITILVAILLVVQGVRLFGR